MADVILPKLGEGIEKAVVSFWHYNTGEDVSEGDDLVEMLTDKATFNVPAPFTGRLTSILAEEGRTINVGEKIAIITEA